MMLLKCFFTILSASIKLRPILATMDTFVISRYLKTIDHSLTSNVFAANRLPVYMTPPTYIISNLDPDTKPGSHWIAIFVDENGFGEYFDSFGRRPEGYQLTFLKKNTKRWIYNNKVIQNIFSSVCGQYCLVYLYLKYRGMSIRNFINMFTNDTIMNDKLLVKMFETFFM